MLEDYMKHILLEMAKSDGLPEVRKSYYRAWNLDDEYEMKLFNNIVIDRVYEIFSEARSSEDFFYKSYDEDLDKATDRLEFRTLPDSIKESFLLIFIKDNVFIPDKYKHNPYKYKKKFENIHVALHIFLEVKNDIEQEIFASPQYKALYPPPDYILELENREAV